MRTSILLDEILQASSLNVAFQPIMARDEGGWRVHALECLTSGPKGTNAEDSNVMFDYVRRKRAEATVDRACIETGLRIAREIPDLPRLALNVHATTLASDRDFVSFLTRTADDCEIDMSRLIIEIVEHNQASNADDLSRTLKDVKQAGAQIALDDVGRGYSNYQMMIDCRPDYLKADRYLIAGIHQDVYRQTVLESITRLAAGIEARLVAECVEDNRELDVVLQMGISLVQGYIFSPPLALSALLEKGFRNNCSDSTPRSAQKWSHTT